MIYEIFIPFNDLGGQHLTSGTKILLHKDTEFNGWYVARILGTDDTATVSRYDLEACCIELETPKCESSQPKPQISQAIKNWLSTLPAKD